MSKKKSKDTPNVLFTNKKSRNIQNKIFFIFILFSWLLLQVNYQYYLSKNHIIQFHPKIIQNTVTQHHNIKFLNSTVIPKVSKCPVAFPTKNPAQVPLSPDLSIFILSPTFTEKSKVHVPKKESCKKTLQNTYNSNTTLLSRAILHPIRLLPGLSIYLRCKAVGG